MSCRELERLVLAGAPGAELATHRSACRSCDALGSDLDLAASLVTGLAAPLRSRELRESLLAIPARTVSCEAAGDLIAARLENEIAPADRKRLEFHFSRCHGCAEAARTLGVAGELVSPRPAPWLAGRVAANRPALRRRSLGSWFLDPKAAIALAYAAAVVVMLAGWNPADLARKAGVAGLSRTTRSAVTVAGNSLADRIGALQERALRSLYVLQGRFSGYGRAALSNALDLVMRPENQRPPGRPRNGEDNGALQKNETEIWTWRA